MSLNYVEIKLDRPRKLRFGIRELREIQARFDGEPLLETLGKLQKASLYHVLNMLLIGLRHEDRTLTPERMEQLVQDYLDRSGRLQDLMNAIGEALNASGLFGHDERAGDAEGGAGRPFGPTSA